MRPAALPSLEAAPRGAVEACLTSGCAVIVNPSARHAFAGVVSLEIMPQDSRPCDHCGGGDDEGLILLCDGCNLPLHAHCVGFAGPVEGDWFCGACSDDQPADSESNQSGAEEASSAAAGA